MTLRVPRVPAQPSLPKRSRSTSRIPSDLRNALTEIARTGVLLVSCDYDGTLAPIVEDPTQARPLDRKSTRLNSSHSAKSRMPSSA